MTISPRLAPILRIATALALIGAVVTQFTIGRFAPGALGVLALALAVAVAAIIVTVRSRRMPRTAHVRR